jgi:MSHA biogenesis protein MshG
MATLCRTGVPITIALKRLAETTGHSSLSSALHEIVEHLEAGEDLASAMQHFQAIFSPLIISMVRVGQSSGNLADAFLRINHYIELEGAAIKNVKTAMRYPAFIVTALVAAIVVINLFVIPSFANVFAQANVNLPWVTRFFIMTSNFFVHYWALILIVVVLSAIGFGYYIHQPLGRVKWHHLLLNLPIVGDILRRLLLLRFSQAFASTIESGVPLIEGIGLVALSINNAYAREKILLMRETVERGNTLTQAAAATGLFDSLELQILSISEDTGELGAMLEQISSYYQREVDYDLKRLNDVIEPLLIIVLSFVILILAFAVYLPIWDMVRAAKVG